MFEPTFVAPDAFLDNLICSIMPRWEHPDDEPDFESVWDHWIDRLSRCGLLKELYDAWAELIQNPQFGKPLENIMLCSGTYCDAMDDYDNAKYDVEQFVREEIEDERRARECGAAW